MICFHRQFYRIIFFVSLFNLLPGYQSQAQTEKYIIQMVKHSSSELRIVTIDNDSRFKAMLNDGQKIKGKVKSFYPGFLVSEKANPVAVIHWRHLFRDPPEFYSSVLLEAV